MAVRNLAAIQRQGAMIAETKKNEYQLKKENVWKRIDIIRASREDAIDMLDTIDALIKNGMRDRFNWWTDRHFFKVNPSEGYFKYIVVLEGCEILYKPRTDEVIFTWNSCCMCEGHSTKEALHDGKKEQYFIERITHKDRRYDELLTRMATKFKPYLDEFFAWVDTM